MIGDQETKRSPVNFLSLIIFTIFLTTLAATAGVYVYKYYLERQIGILKQDFEAAKKDFNQTFVDEASRLSQRLSASKDILKNHVSASAIFDLLQRNTLQTVAFNNFGYSKDDLGNVKITTSGVAKNYSSIALQSDAFVEQISCIKNPVFSGLSLDSSGNVVFKFDAVLDLGVVNYSKNMTGNFCQNASQSSLTSSSTTNTN